VASPQEVPLRFGSLRTSKAMSHLQPGDYVECIDNRRQFRMSMIMPELDQLYTVESASYVAGGYSIRLNELAPACHKGGICICGSCGWDARRFKRVYRPDPRNLAPFRSMLRASKPAIPDPVPVEML
jgi:hypothetical protein